MSKEEEKGGTKGFFYDYYWNEIELNLKNVIEELQKEATPTKIIDSAVNSVDFLKTIKYLKRVIEVGFNIYSISLNFGPYTAFSLTSIEDDSLFSKAYDLFKVRGFDPSLKTYGQSFIECICTVRCANRAMRVRHVLKPLSVSQMIEG